MKNPIISELRRFRDSEAKRYNYDIEAMAADLMALEPWMRAKTYTLRGGKLAPIAQRPAKRRPQSRPTGRHKSRG
jgi:hypothetical protein